MLMLLRQKSDQETLKKAAEDLEGYIKFVVDIERNIMTIGGSRHVDGEQLLIKAGSKQTDLWGGGFDLETREIDFDSMINIRPSQGNTSREVLSEAIRTRMRDVVSNFIA